MQIQVSAAGEARGFLPRRPEDEESAMMRAMRIESFTGYGGPRLVEVEKETFTCL